MEPKTPLMIAKTTARRMPSISRARKRSSRLPGWPGPYGWVGAPGPGTVAVAPAGGGGGGGGAMDWSGGGTVAGFGGGGGAGVGSPGGGVDPTGGSLLLMQCAPSWVPM